MPQYYLMLLPRPKAVGYRDFRNTEPRLWSDYFDSRLAAEMDRLVALKNNPRVHPDELVVMEVPSRRQPASLNGGLGRRSRIANAVSLRTHAGTLVVIEATPFDRAEYARRWTGCNQGYGLPPNGTTGVVAAIGRGGPTAIGGPGGGLVCVRFYKNGRDLCHIGVPPASLRKAYGERVGLGGCSCARRTRR